MKVTVTQAVEKDVASIQASCGVRYWEDAAVNGVEDENGDLMPLRDGDRWCPTIDLESGKVDGWPEGTSARIHYKVCDDGEYRLLDGLGQVVAEIDGYVPSIMSPADNGFGDYVIMNIGPDGVVEDWKPDLSAFEGIPD